MAVVATFEPNGMPTPETRAAVMGECMRIAATQVQALDFSTMFDGVLKTFNASEEQLAHEINVSFFLLVRSGLVVSNRDHIGHDTTILPSPIVLNLIWKGPEDYPEDA